MVLKARYATRISGAVYLSTFAPVLSTPGIISAASAIPLFIRVTSIKTGCIALTGLVLSMFFTAVYALFRMRAQSLTGLRLIVEYLPLASLTGTVIMSGTSGICPVHYPAYSFQINRDIYFQFSSPRLTIFILINIIFYYICKMHYNIYVKF